MRIGFISDLHLGFGKDKEIYEDVFSIAEKIFLNLSKICDVIFIAGDLFDEKDPDNEVILKTIRIFKKCIHRREEKIKFSINGEEKEERVPIIFAIHGNHDRKFRDETSVYKIFEELNIFHYIVYGKIVFENEKVVIYAMSNVPERYSRSVLLEKFNPKPIKDYFNILVLHQNIYPYVYTIEETSLKISDLPRNFNLIVNGHIHIRNVEKIENSTLLILGSPIITQVNEREINEKRGYNIVDIQDKENFKILFNEIEQERRYYLLEIDTEKFNLNFLEEKINQIIKSSSRKPFIKIKLVGKREIEDKVIKNILEKFEEKAIIKFESLVENEKAVISSKVIELVRERKSIDEIILNTVLEKLKENKFSNSFDFQKLIELFEDGDVETLIDILTKSQKTLERIR